MLHVQYIQPSELYVHGKAKKKKQSNFEIVVQYLDLLLEMRVFSSEFVKRITLEDYVQYTDKMFRSN